MNKFYIFSLFLIQCNLLSDWLNFITSYKCYVPVHFLEGTQDHVIYISIKIIVSKNKLRPRVLSYRHTKLRYLALFFACMIMIGDAYCFDNPMAL